MDEFWFHGVRKESNIEDIKTNGFKSGFLTDDYDLAWSFATSGIILKIEKSKFKEGTLKTTTYFTDGKFGSQHEYTGSEYITDIKIIEAP